MIKSSLLFLFPVEVNLKVFSKGLPLHYSGEIVLKALNVFTIIQFFTLQSRHKLCVFLRTTQSSSVSIMEKQKRYTEGKRSSWHASHRSELDPSSPFSAVCFVRSRKGGRGR